jgi:ammonia channel protein AmtB
MRIVPIVVGLIVGLVGLFMSVCGGGFLVSLGYDTLRNLFGVHRDPGAIGGLFVLLLPTGSLALGIVVCRSAYQILREHLKDK